MTWLIALFARWGVAERLRRPLGYLTAGIALASLLGLLWAIWLHFHDAKVIADHEAPIAAQVAAATSAANDAANANDAARREAAARADERMKGALADAQAKNPEAARADAGPVTRAALDQLRQRPGAARPPAR